MRVFKALKTFDSDDLRSTYLKGLSYTIDDNNKLLNACSEVWALQGKVQFDHIIAPHACAGIGGSFSAGIGNLVSGDCSMTGVGTVSGGGGSGSLTNPFYLEQDGIVFE